MTIIATSYIAADVLKFREKINVRLHIMRHLFSTLESVHTHLDSTPIFSNQFKLPHQN